MAGNAGTIDAELERPALRWGWAFGAIWLVYLADPFGAALHARPGPARDIGVAAIVAFAVTYLGVLVRGRRNRYLGGGQPRWLPWAQIAALIALTLAAVPAAHQHALSALVFVAAAAMFSIRGRAAWVVVIALAAGSELAVQLVPGWSDNGAGLGVVLAAVAVAAIRIAHERNRRLLETRGEMAQLAVTAERSRFARDLHDILGHSLTVITVKAELAGRLVHDQPERAAAEIADVERLSREALADVRRAVAAIHEVTLTNELATARESLTAAGIEPDLPAAVDEVPGELRELFGWVVREGVTNVIRHGRARRCVVRVGPTSVEIVDDGVGTAAPSGTGGHGLAGLRERARVRGAVVSAGPAGPEGGFRLRVAVTGAVDSGAVDSGAEASAEVTRRATRTERAAAARR